MTIKILKKTVNIELCHELFKTRVYYDTFEKQYVRLQSGKQEAASEDVAWTERDGFWMYMPELWDENYFGLCEQRPSAWETQSIACGFDFKNDGSGAFGRDEFGGILVLHTGDIPIGSDEAKAFFLAALQRSSCEWGGTQQSVCSGRTLGCLGCERTSEGVP